MRLSASLAAVAALLAVTTAAIRRAARCVMDSPNAMRRAQWRAVAAVVGARSRLRPLVYGAAGASAAVDAGRCVYRTQAHAAHAASASESF